MIETPPTAVEKDIRTEEEKEIDAKIRRYSDIPEPVPEKDNPNALFANGWGRREQLALLVASSGIGKSVITTQLFVPWALGKPGLIGSDPIRPLRVAYIQAEDDDTEMGEFRRDHRRGYISEGWDINEIKKAESLVWDMSEIFDGLCDDDFIRKLDMVLKRYPQDVVIMNPFQSYTAFDLNDKREMVMFVQHGLLKTLKAHGAFMLVVHHTNKPNYNAIAKGGAWSADDLAAYAGSGSGALTNAARSVTFIRRCTSKESKLKNSFMLIGAKRGNRLGWKDADGNWTNQRIIAYSKDYIHWRIPKPEEIAAANSPAAPSGEDGQSAPLEPLTPEAAADMIAEVVRAEWPKKGICAFCRDRLCSKMRREEFKAGWECFTMNHKHYGLKMVEDGRGAYHFEPIPAAEPQDLDGLNDNDSQPNYGGDQ